MGSCCIAQRAQLCALRGPRWVGGGEGGREAQWGGEVRIFMADSQYCTAEIPQRCKAIILYLKQNKIQKSL